MVVGKRQRCLEPWAGDTIFLVLYFIIIVITAIIIRTQAQHASFELCRICEIQGNAHLSVEAGAA